MTDRREHIRRALRACAEQGVPDTTVPWIEIRGRALAGRGRVSHGKRFVPRTRVGWALVALMVMLFSMGAYAAGGLLFKAFQYELPGGDAMELGHKLDMSQTANDARVTLQWAYADAGSVVVGFDIRDLKEKRRVGGYPTRLDPVLDPAADWWEGAGAVANYWPDSPVLTSTNNIRFGSQGTSWQGGGDSPTTVVFVPSERLEPGERHRFRLEVPVQARPHMPGKASDVDRPPPEPVGGRPFAFDFEIPVQRAPVVRVDERAEADEVTLTLKRVMDSPGRPQAVICFDPPDRERDWFISDFEGVSVPGEREENCREILLRSSLEGSVRITVERLEGLPRPGTFSNDREFNEKIRTIRGPWTFEFEMPER